MVGRASASLFSVFDRECVVRRTINAPGGGSEVPEALLEPGVGAGLTGSPW